MGPGRKYRIKLYSFVNGPSHIYKLFLQVNFAEAALFLQGTASVYSKKVEFLWQRVLNMLDTLASKKALDEAAAGGDGAGGLAGKKLKKGFVLDPNDFSQILIDLGKNVDMKLDAVGSSHAKR